MYICTWHKMLLLKQNDRFHKNYSRVHECKLMYTSFVFFRRSVSLIELVILYRFIFTITVYLFKIRFLEGFSHIDISLEKNFYQSWFILQVKILYYGVLLPIIYKKNYQIQIICTLHILEECTIYILFKECTAFCLIYLCYVHNED